MAKDSLIEQSMKDLKRLMVREWNEHRDLHGSRSSGFSDSDYQKVYDALCTATLKSLTCKPLEQELC